jgi:hypothetical protein
MDQILLMTRYHRGPKPTNTRRQAETMTELERCDAEIAEIERQLRSGHHDVEGLCLSLSDWSAEKRLLISRSDADLIEESAVSTSLGKD